MFFPKLQYGFRWSLPWLYARPNYFMVVTPFGTQHIGYPPIYVLPAFGILFLVTIACIYFFVCRPCGGLCCCCRKCLSCCARRCRCWGVDGRIKVLLITDIFGNKELKNLLALLLLTNMVKKQKIDIVGIVTTGGNNSCRTKHAIEWLRYLELEKEIPVVSSRDIDESANVFLEEVDSRVQRKPAKNSTRSPTKLILNMAKVHGNSLHIYSTTGTALTPLRDAIQADKSKCLKKIGGLYLNNLQVKCSTSNKDSSRSCPCCSNPKATKIIIPSDSNAKKGDEIEHLIDSPSMHCVFKSLQAKVPFTVFIVQPTSVAGQPESEKGITINSIIRKILSSKTYLKSSQENVYAVKTGGISTNSMTDFAKVVSSSLFALYIDGEVSNESIFRVHTWGKHHIVKVKAEKNIEKTLSRFIESGIDYHYCI